jgi:hypothetical protein
MATKKTNTAVGKKQTPKFGEVGYKFTMEAEITEIHREDDENNYPFTITINVGGYSDTEYGGSGKMTFYYDRKPLLDLITHTNPKIVLDEKKAELKKAQDLVTRITKEISVLSK